MLRRLLPVCLLLAACSSEPELRYAVPQIESGPRVSTSARSVEVREVTLPVYAEDERIYTMDETGALVASDVLLWADDPARSMTLTLSRVLGEITTAQVAGEPWPFEAFPDARLEVRVDEMIARFDGIFRLSGQYYVGSPDRTHREYARSFAVNIPFAPEGGVGAIAAARAAAVRDLARIIAQTAL